MKEGVWLGREMSDSHTTLWRNLASFNRCLSIDLIFNPDWDEHSCVCGGYWLCQYLGRKPFKVALTTDGTLTSSSDFRLRLRFALEQQKRRALIDIDFMNVIRTSILHNTIVCSKLNPTLARATGRESLYEVGCCNILLVKVSSCPSAILAVLYECTFPKTGNIQNYNDISWG